MWNLKVILNRNYLTFSEKDGNSRISFISEFKLLRIVPIVKLIFVVWSYCSCTLAGGCKRLVSYDSLMCYLIYLYIRSSERHLEHYRRCGLDEFKWFHDSLKASEATIKGDLRKLRVNLFHPCVVCGSFLSSGSNLNKHIGRKHAESHYEDLCIWIKSLDNWYL